MPGDITTVIVKPSDSTILTVTSNDITVIQSNANVSSNNEITILNVASATITAPTSLQLSDSIPLTLTENGASGASSLAARADHVHPTTGMTLNGGNF